VYTRDSGGGDRWVPIDLLSAAPESNICRSHPSRVSAPGMHPSKLCSRQTMIIITAEHNTLYVNNYLVLGLLANYVPAMMGDYRWYISFWPIFSPLNK
jgi:hypothetical protein